MDPLTALTQLVTAITHLVTVAMEGQTPAQKAQLWEWYLTDVSRWRKLLHIDEPKP